MRDDDGVVQWLGRPHSIPIYGRRGPDPRGSRISQKTKAAQTFLVGLAVRLHKESLIAEGVTRLSSRLFFIIVMFAILLHRFISSKIVSSAYFI